MSESTVKVQHATGIHHTLWPSTDLERTKNWYEEVIGLKWVDISKMKKMSELTVLIMTGGDFDLHFCPVEPQEGGISLDPYHFSLEIEDWDAFIAHLDDLGIEYREVRYRPQNNSKTSEIRDPDGHRVEFVWHGDRHE